MVRAMAPLLSGGADISLTLTHGLLLLARSSSSHRCPSGVILPQRARMRRSPSGPCATVSGLRARLVRLFMPHICCGRAPARSAARTRSRSQSMVSRSAFTLFAAGVLFPACRANGLARHRRPAAPPASAAASQPWLPARVPPFPGWQPAVRRALRCAPPLFPPWAEAAARGAQQVRSQR